MERRRFLAVTGGGLMGLSGGKLLAAEWSLTSHQPPIGVTFPATIARGTELRAVCSARGVIGVESELPTPQSRQLTLTDAAPSITFGVVNGPRFFTVKVIQGSSDYSAVVALVADNATRLRVVVHEVAAGPAPAGLHGRLGHAIDVYGSSFTATRFLNALQAAGLDSVTTNLPANGAIGVIVLTRAAVAAAAGPVGLGAAVGAAVMWGVTTAAVDFALAAHDAYVRSLVTAGCTPTSNSCITAADARLVGNAAHVVGGVMALKRAVTDPQQIERFIHAAEAGASLNQTIDTSNNTATQILSSGAVGTTRMSVHAFRIRPR